MRTIITLVIMLLSITSVQAMDPPVIEWEVTLGSVFYDVHETIEGNYIVGALDSVLLFSPQGDIIWVLSSSSINWFYAKFQFVLPLSSGGFIASGVGKEFETSSYSIPIIHFDENGNLIWSRNYGFNEFTEYAFDAVELPDSGFAFAARKGGEAWILRTDAQGDTLWTREWGWQYNDKAMSILYIDNGLTVLIHGNTPTTPGGPHLVRYDLDGNMLWETDIPVLAGKYGQDMCEAADGGLLILTNMYPVLAHTDYFGNVDWYTNPHYDYERLITTYGWSIDTTMDGGILYGGENRWQPGNTTIEQSGMINRMDYEGSFLWRDFIYNSSCSVIYSVRQLSQGGYIAAGKASGQGFLIKYAPELGIESGDVSPAVTITSVSPNPFSSSLSITCSLPSPMSASLAVYDLNGRIVDVVEAGTFPAGEHRVSWIPSPELSAGCYLIRLQTDAGTDVRNCVLLAE